MAKVKSYIMAETENVKSVKQLISNLEKRKIYEMCGLALVWGAPGLGKTRCLTRLGLERGYVFIRLDSTTSQRTFILRFRDGISYKFNLALPPAKGSSDKIFRECLEYLNQHQVTIVIDEIDYAFSDRKLLGTIRDIVDNAPMTNVVLIGMSEAYEKLKKANAHYFDRCNQFYKFKHLDQEDTRLICEALTDYDYPEIIINEIYNSSHGIPRKIVKELQAVDELKLTKR